MGSYTSPSGGGGSEPIFEKDPVSIQLSGSSTTVPQNETWVVNIGVHSGSGNTSKFQINGVGFTQSSKNNDSPHPPQFRMTLTGGDTVSETSGAGNSMVSIQGFVVDS